MTWGWINLFFFWISANMEYKIDAVIWKKKKNLRIRSPVSEKEIAGLSKIIHKNHFTVFGRIRRKKRKPKNDNTDNFL